MAFSLHNNWIVGCEMREKMRPTSFMYWRQGCEISSSMWLLHDIWETSVTFTLQLHKHNPLDCLPSWTSIFSSYISFHRNSYLFIIVNQLWTLVCCRLTRFLVCAESHLIYWLRRRSNNTSTVNMDRGCYNCGQNDHQVTAPRYRSNSHRC